MKIDAMKTTSALCAAGVLGTALLGLIGYFSGFRLLGSIRPEYIPMAPSTGVSFILVGAVLWFLHAEQLSRIKVSVLFVLIAFVSLFGLLDAMGSLSGVNLNFEESLFPVSGDLNGVPIGLMSPATGVTFFLFGNIALLMILRRILPERNKVIEYAAGGLIILILVISFIFSLAYLYGNPLLYGYAALIPMAFPTAIGFILISVSALTLEKDCFPLRFLTDNSTRGFLLRYILPLTIFSVILGGATGFSSVQLLHINPAIISAAITILIAFSTGFIASMISRHIGLVIDKQHNIIKQADQELMKREEQYRVLFETMAQGVVYQSASGEITSANPAAERILGLSLAQMKGMTSIDRRWQAVDENKNELPGEKHPAMIALRTGKEVKDFVQGIYDPKKNDYIWIIINSVPQFNEGNNKPYQVYSTFRDITDRKKAEEELRKLKDRLEKEVKEKTKELRERVSELERFRDATIDRELRMKELRDEIERLKGRRS